MTARRRVRVTAVLVHGPPERAAELAAAGIDVVRAATVADARAAAGGAQVVVVDLAGPGALALVAAVTDDRPGTAVLAVAASDEHTLAAVRAGATGYVVDPVPGAVAEAVRRLVRGEPAFGRGVAAEALESRGVPGEAAVRLSDREAEVLRLVVEGLTARQIATRLVLSPRTVENHVRSLLRKLGVANRAALVRHAIEHGLA